MAKKEKPKAYRPVEESLRRSKEAWALKDFWKPIMEECYELALAGISPYQGDKNKPRTAPRQYDSTAPNAVIRLANRILNEMTPPFDDWADVVPGPILERDLSKSQLEELKKQLESVSAMTNMIVNQREQVGARYAAILDMLISCMGCMLDLEDPTDDISPVNTQCVSQAEVAILEDGRQRVSDICRKRTIKLSKIKGLWPDAVIPDEITQGSKKDKDPDIEVIEITYAVEGGKKQGSNLPAWAYEVLYTKGGKNAEIMVQRGYNENPWTILRWMTLPGCPYGPSPVMLALADIRVANKIVEMILQNAALAIAGMYTVRDDGVVNPDNIQITTAGMIPVGSNGGGAGPSIMPLETGRGFEIGQIAMQDYQTRIKKWLFDNGLPDATGAVRSPTEIIERVREITQDLGAGVVRVSGDLVEHVRRVINILIRRGFIPFDINIDQFTFKVQINSPLARTPNLQKVQTVVQWLEIAKQSGGDQALIVVAKMPEILTWIADQMGVPADLVNTETEREKAMQSMAEVQAAPALAAQAEAAVPASA